MWTTWAFDLMGMNDAAMRHLAFLGGLVRQEERPECPKGSLPFAAYANGVDAAPAAMLDAQAAASFLWAVAKHAERLSDTERAQFVGERWKTVEMASGFLVNWADPATRLPLPSFRVERLRDGRDDDLLVSAYIGMQSATRLAKWAAVDKPDWRVRQTDLESLARYRLLDDQNRWKPADPLRYWASGLVPRESPAWDEAVTAALKALDTVDADELPDRLVALATLTKTRPDARAQFVLAFPVAMKRAMGLPAEGSYTESHAPVLIGSPAAAKLIVAMVLLFQS